MAGVMIEPAAISHATDFAAVRRTAMRQAMPFLPDLHSEAEDLVFYTNVLRTQTVFVALDEQRRAVGFIAHSGDSIEHLYVLPSHQGVGIGSRLLQQVMELSGTLKLWTFERNENARRFYEKRGFSVIDRTDGAGNEEHEPDLLLLWSRTAGAMPPTAIS